MRYFCTVLFHCLLTFSLSVSAATTTVDSSVHTTTTTHSGSSPTVIILSDLVRYVFYRDSGGTCVYSKTTNGATSWGTAVTVDSQTDCLGMAIWYDRWTPGDTTGNYVHILTWDSGSDDTWYTRLDTSSDTLTTTVSASGSGQGGSFNNNANYGSITKGTNETLYMGIQDGSDSFVLKCSSTCTTATNWSEAGTNPFDLVDDQLILMPLASDNIMAIRWDVSADDIQSKVYTNSSSTWDASWTTIDSNAGDNTTYDAAFGATVDKTTNNIYLAYGADIGTLGGSNDDIRTAVYNGSSWTSKTDVLTNSTTRAPTGVKIAFDENNGAVYVVYSARTSSGTSTTGNVYTKSSTDGMATWSAESSAVNATAADIYGARVNIMSNERIYASWWASNTILGNTVADLTPPTVAFTSSSSSGSEGTTSVNLELTLSSASIQTVTVDYAVTGTATGSGTDYTLASGTATITAGATTANISMTVVDDTLDETDETVIVTISNPTNSSLGTNTTDTYTITDDDATPTVDFTASAQSSSTESGSLTVTATLSAVSGQEVTVPFTVTGTATSGTDYTITSSPISIAAGSSSGSVTIAITSDTTDESNESVILTMGTPTNATAGSTTTHTATITDDDSPPVLTISDTTVSEGGGTVTVTASMTGDSSSTVTVNYATSNGSATSGSDYTSASGTLTWTASQTGGKTFTISIMDDSLDEDDETITVTLSSVANATLSGSTATVTITDDDATPSVFFTSSSQSSAGETGTLTVTAQLSAASGQEVTVPFTVTGTATSGTDYTITSSPISISAGSSSGTATITITSDSIDELDETVVVTMGTPTKATAGATTVHTATITDDDSPPTVSWTASAQSSSNESGTLTVTAQLSAASGQEVTVPFTLSGTATNGTDYSLTSSPLTISAGSTTAAATITINDDSVSEGNETVILTIGTPTNATAGSTAVHTATITDDDTIGVTITESGGSTNVTEGSTTADTYTVVLKSQPTSDVTVTVSPNAQLSVGSTTTLTFTSADWNTAQTISVTAVDDSVAEGNHTDTMTHSVSSSDTNYNGLAVDSVTANLTDNDTAGVSVTESSGSTFVTEGGTTDDTYTIVLTSQPTNDVTISLSSGAQLTTSSSTLTFTSSNWNVAQTITVTPVDDSVVEGSHSATITHTATSSDSNYNGISVNSISSAITDNDTAGVSVSESSGSTTVTEGGDSDTYTVVLTSQPLSTVTLTMNADGEVSVDSSALTFTTSNWNAPQTITVTAVDDSEVNGSRASTITHSASSSDIGYNTIGISDIVVQITDNESDSATEGDTPPPTPVVADAGEDVTTVSGASVTLDGTGSTGDDLVYQWIITSGNGTIDDDTSANPLFTASSSGSSLEDVTITLIVTDSLGDVATSGVSTDEVVIHILPSTVSSQVVDQPLVGFVEEVSLFEVSSTTGGNITTSLVLNDGVMELPEDCGHYAFAMTRSRHLVLGCPDIDNNKGTVFISLDVIDNLLGVIDLSLPNDFFISISGQNNDDQLGKYIATGDVNGDDNDDIMAAAPGGGTDGEIYIIEPDDNTVRSVLIGTSTIRLTSVLASDFLSAGAEDLFFGPDNEALNQNLRRQSAVSIDAMIGTAYMLQGDINAGNMTPDSNTIDASISNDNETDAAEATQSTQSTTNLFQSVAMGDLNDDDNADVAMASNDGLAYIFFGPLGISSRLNSLDADVLISEGEGLDSFGRMMMIGDVTGDGIGDLVIGAPDYGTDGSGSGGVFVLFGRTNWASSYDVTTTSNTDFLLVAGSEAGDGIGSDLVLADTDSDQVNEIYTIKGLTTVYQISLTNTASFSGSPSSATTGGGSSESAAGATNGFGCSLNLQATLNPTFWLTSVWLASVWLASVWLASVWLVLGHGLRKRKFRC